MSTKRNAGVFAAVIGVMALFGSCSDDDPPPAPAQSPTWYATPTFTPAAPETTYDDSATAESDSPDTQHTITDGLDDPGYDEPDVDSPHVKRARNGRCRDSHGRFTRCP